MSKNLRLTTNVKLNTQTNISDKDRKKLSSNNLNSKIYNNIYLSPNKNLNYQQDEERNNYRSNNNYNSIHTEESKNEVRSNSYNKMKPSNYFCFFITFILFSFSFVKWAEKA